ncbi:MAG: hypothetical protein Q8K58_00500 [Acidimicrobiales bacterium]|nr:hypothetical protein [Acidimicrobiales bacterium]
MRRTAAAILVAIVVAVGVSSAPLVASHAAPADDVAALVGRVDALVAPLAPVLAVASPQLADALQRLGEPGASRADQLAAVRRAQAELQRFARPALSALGLAGTVDPLTSALGELAATLEQELAGGGQPAAEAAGAPEAAPLVGAGGAGPAPAAPRGFGGGSLSTSSAGGTTSSGSVPSVPSVPVGATPSFPALALPDFSLRGFDMPGAAETPRTSAKEKEELQLAADLATPQPDTDNATALAVVLALSALLLAGSLVTRKFRPARLPFR